LAFFFALRRRSAESERLTSSLSLKRPPYRLSPRGAINSLLVDTRFFDFFLAFAMMNLSVKPKIDRFGQ
jgi:hypothetical protein